jgi:VanZ family protein
MFRPIQTRGTTQRPDRRSGRRVVALLSLIAGGALILWGGLSAQDPLAPFIASDDVRHVLCFAILGVCAGSVPDHSARLALMGLALALGPGLEGLQAFSPGRTPSLDDALHSILGGALGCGVGRLISAVGERRPDTLAGPRLAGAL